MPRRRFFKSDTWEFGHESRADEQPLAQPGKKRAATTIVYAAMFFAGATFTAIAGDHFAQMTSSEDAAATATDSTSTDATTTDASDAASSDALSPASAAPASDSAPDSSAGAGLSLDRGDSSPGSPLRGSDAGEARGPCS